MTPKKKLEEILKLTEQDYFQLLFEQYSDVELVRKVKEEIETYKALHFNIKYEYNMKTRCVTYHIEKQEPIGFKYQQKDGV
jgi:hypothetical protein